MLGGLVDHAGDAARAATDDGVHDDQGDGSTLPRLKKRTGKSRKSLTDLRFFLAHQRE